MILFGNDNCHYDGRGIMEVDNPSRLEYLGVGMQNIDLLYVHVFNLQHWFDDRKLRQSVSTYGACVFAF